jgi:MarR family transcriptional regulator for hemolysin
MGTCIDDDFIFPEDLLLVYQLSYEIGDSMKSLDYMKRIFAHIVLVARKWEVMYNRVNKDDELTLKQFMMLIIIIDFSEKKAPSIKEVADQMSTSHQNVKAITELLEKKGFISLYQDEQDLRVTRIRLLKEKSDYWGRRNDKDQEMLQTLFSDITIEDLAVTYRTVKKLDNIASQWLKKE